MVRASERRLIATLGVEDLVVIDTADATLGARKDRMQDVKAIVERLRGAGRTEHLFHRKFDKEFERLGELEVEFNPQHAGRTPARRRSRCSSPALVTAPLLGIGPFPMQDEVDADLRYADLRISPPVLRGNQPGKIFSGGCTIGDERTLRVDSAQIRGANRNIPRK